MDLLGGIITGNFFLIDRMPKKLKIRGGIQFVLLLMISIKPKKDGKECHVKYSSMLFIM